MYWAGDKYVLVQKSPQDMLKMDLIRKVFEGAKAIKFLVIIKVYIHNI